MVYMQTLIAIMHIRDFKTLFRCMCCYLEASIQAVCTQPLHLCRSTHHHKLSPIDCPNTTPLDPRDVCSHHPVSILHPCIHLHLLQWHMALESITILLNI